MCSFYRKYLKLFSCSRALKYFIFCFTGNIKTFNLKYLIQSFLLWSFLYIARILNKISIGNKSWCETEIHQQIIFNLSWESCSWFKVFWNYHKKYRILFRNINFVPNQSSDEMITQKVKPIYLNEIDDCFVISLVSSPFGQKKRLF